MGFVVDRATLRQVFSEYFRLPCHSSSPLIAPHSSPSIIQGWYKRPISGRSNSGLGSISATYIIIGTKKKEEKIQRAGHYAMIASYYLINENHI
jgi:hypothetical protein